MWTCEKCGRSFEKKGQFHSCQKVPLEQHFRNKTKAKELFDLLVDNVNDQVGKVQIISLPCCVHLYGKYDFLAVLPKKNNLEIRFALNRKLEYPRLKQGVLIAADQYKNCIDINETKEVNEELIKWLSEAYHLKDNS
jgi:hypothetical protein